MGIEGLCLAPAWRQRWPHKTRPRYGARLRGHPDVRVGPEMPPGDKQAAHRWGHAGPTPPAPPQHCAQPPAAPVPRTGVLLTDPTPPDSLGTMGHWGGTRAALNTSTLVLGAPGHPHHPCCMSQLPPACIQTHLWHCRGALPLHTHTHLGASQWCSSLAHAPSTPGGCCPLCALSLEHSHTSLSGSHAPPYPPPLSPSPARPVLADTNGKSPPVRASWQALSEGFRVPQPAPPTSATSTLSHAGGHTRGRTAPCFRPAPPSDPPQTTPKSITTLKHTGPAPSSHLTSLPLLCAGHPLCISEAEAPSSTRGPPQELSRGTHSPWDPPPCDATGPWVGSTVQRDAQSWGTGCSQVALTPPPVVPPRLTPAVTRALPALRRCH